MRALARAHTIAALLAVICDDVRMCRSRKGYRLSAPVPGDPDLQAAILPVLDQADRYGQSAHGVLWCEVDKL